MKTLPGLFDYENRMEKLAQTISGLDRLNSLINWEMFRSPLEEALKKGILSRMYAKNWVISL